MVLNASIKAFWYTHKGYKGVFMKWVLDLRSLNLKQKLFMSFLEKDWMQDCLDQLLVEEQVKTAAIEEMEETVDVLQSAAIKEEDSSTYLPFKELEKLCSQLSQLSFWEELLLV